MKFLQLRTLLPCLLLLSSVAFAQRLPDTVVPEHYTLTLTPNLKDATFAGREQIDVLVKQPAAAITLNAAEIKFLSVTAEVNGKKWIATVTTDPQKEQATFHFEHSLPAGRIALSIDYTGILNNELRGFYLSKTAKRNYAVTQFEPTDARRAFPSFDEPAFKATFNVSLVIDTGDTAISNTNIVSDKPGPQAGEHTIQFATTPKMSTYLVAFLVGDFQCISGSSDGTPIRVCGTPGKAQYGHFALSAAEFVLHYYNTYFGIRYPMPKLDLIGIPDFEAGAMENFGAITYRETDLFIDEKTASVGAKKNVAEVVAHEMAHQWFGDMVTMQWWNNIWLNEGFATWMEHKPVAAWHPEWHIPQDVTADLNSTLDYDAQRITRTIRANADTPAEINQMFDAISYGKAAAVLLMTENYEGPETFRKGVHRYLEAHMFGNATAEDFWNAQAEVSHQPVDKVLSSFVAEPGEPLLTFEQPSGGAVQVSQSRFFLNPTIQPGSQQTWSVPVCFAAGASQQHCDLLHSPQQSLHAPRSKVFFPDAEGKGYYRFALPPDVYAKVVAGVETALTPEERIALVGNQWAAARANKASVGDYLNLVTAVKDDSNVAVITTAVRPVSAIYSRIATTADEKKVLAAWVVRTFKPAYQRIGPPAAEDSPDKKELRATLFAVLGNIGRDPDVIAQAKQLAEQYLHQPTSVEPSLGQAAVQITAENGDSAFFDELQHTYETANNPQIQEFALRMLSLFRNPDLERRGLEYAVSGKVRNQDAIIQLLIALEMTDSRDVTWDFIRNNWDKVRAQITTMMGPYLIEGTGYFCSEDKKQQVEEFFQTHPVPAAEHALQRAQDSIDDCIQLRSDQESKLQQWIADQPAQ